MQLVILDRDGVINEDSDDYIRSPGQWRPIPGSLAAIARLYRAGWRVVVATNQSGVARGLIDIDTLMRIHQKMYRAVKNAGGQIDGVPLFGQPAHQDLAEGDIVLDDQQAHRDSVAVAS